MLDTTTCLASFQGGGGQAVFPVPFPFLDPAHIRAYVTRAGGLKETLVAGVDYTVKRITDANGELILLGPDLPAGCSLTLVRLVPLTQEILFHNQGPNSPRAIEEAADKLTMIAQQLDSRIEECFARGGGEGGEGGGDDGNTVLPEDIAELLAGTSARIDGVQENLDALDGRVGERLEALDSRVQEGLDSLAAAAPREHVHALAAVSGLEGELAAKAARVHTHATADVSGLAAALAAKADSNDSRFDAVKSHAATHAKGGADPITPETIGALSAPPSDGKPYLAAAGGWIEYIAPTSVGESEGGTSDHAQLENRDAADQHPQSAIRNLTGDLAALRASIDAGTGALRSSLDSESAALRASLAAESAATATALAAKADKTSLPTAVTTAKDGLMTAADKVKLNGLPSTVNSLPGGGSAGHFLVNSASGVGSWKTPADAAGSLPVMSASQKGVARLSSGAGLELDAGGALRLSTDNLISKTTVEARLQTLDTRTSGLPARLDAAEAGIIGLNNRQNGLGAMAAVADAPRNGKPHARQDGAWVEAASSGGGGGGAVLGEIRFFPFRATALPAGWYFCNGDKYSTATPQGNALVSLPAQMKSDWGLTLASGSINLPKLFDGAGQGYFIRPVDSSSRQPGHIQPDAIRNIAGLFGVGPTTGIVYANSPIGKSTLTGPFTTVVGTKAQSYGPTNHGANTISDLYFDASLAVPVAPENRPVNIGMTPAIYLGV